MATDWPLRCDGASSRPGPRRRSQRRRSSCTQRVRAREIPATARWLGLLFVVAVERPLTIRPSTVMDAVNFSFNGTRFRVTPITEDDLKEVHVPALTTTGLLFTSAEGDMRFLPLGAGALPSFESLRAKQNA